MSTVFSTQVEPASIKVGAALRIMPSGYFRTRDGRPSGQISDWHLDAQIAAKLIAATAPSGGAYVIDYEHQTLKKSDNGQIAPAAGWFKGLEWREGKGLFMTQIEWTDRARQMIASREYRYLSPTFHFDPITGDVTALHSVALTNDPALLGLVDLAAASAIAALTASGASQQAAQLTEKDRANFLHVFGDVPGFCEASGLKPAPEPTVSRADLAAMTEKDRANFMHVFGDSISISES
ncbi:phage protease [Comamonas resistens]|uniref:phage protease n=1 Tax=Comamonas resistens TaxID=3046670 RepID=UPI0039BD2D1C